jgi:hypothetical protein
VINTTETIFVPSAYCIQLVETKQNKKPNKSIGGFTMAYSEEKHEDGNLNALIQSAIKKINGKKENDICRYLPSETGGYIHHFTMRKMKTENPEKLKQLINSYITKADRPQSVPPKSRAARGSRKRRDQFAFTKIDLERMLNMARMAGDKEMVRKLTPKKDLRTIKRELITSIRHGHIDQELWQSYVEIVTVQTTAANTAAAAAQ